MLRDIAFRTMAGASLALLPAVAAAQDVHVAKTSGCGCCVGWMEHMEEHGFRTVGEDMFGGALVRLKLEKGVPAGMASCHTATVDGYVIEGHVPAADVRRLLQERPDAVGLAVPDMPLGSPGMDFGNRVEPYEVHLINHDGTTEVFTSYPAE